jgi:hypothetical protein
MNLDSTAAILRDIHELDAVPVWPLAPGWWVLAGLAVLVLLTFAIRYWLRYSGLMPGWRGDARRQLRALHKAIKQEHPREIAGRLSILLRRVAMARSGRHGTASLSGDEWLGWLEEHDSTGFRWSSRGKLLLHAPYMPPSWEVDRREVTRLVVAARRWIEAVTPADRRKSRRKRTRQFAQGRRSHV